MVWQAPPDWPHCTRSSRQASPLAGMAAPLSSTAEPAKAIESPTFQVVPAAGEEIVASGGEPALIVTAVMSVTPPLSVTRRRTL